MTTARQSKNGRAPANPSRRRTRHRRVRAPAWGEVKFELYGAEMTQKTVTASGTCGRVYLPLAWVGKRVKIIRLD